MTTTLRRLVSNGDSVPDVLDNGEKVSSQRRKRKRTLFQAWMMIKALVCRIPFQMSYCEGQEECLFR